MHAHTLICVCTIVPSVCAEAAESVQIRARLGFARSRDTVPDTVDGRGSLSLPPSTELHHMAESSHHTFIEPATALLTPQRHMQLEVQRRD